MRGKLLIQSATISALLVAILSTFVLTVYADCSTVDKYDTYGYGSYVTSAVQGYGYPGVYYAEDYYSVRYKGSGNYYGSMYYCWFADEDFTEGYTNENYLYDVDNKYCELVASYTRSSFKYGQTEYSLDALAYVPV